MTRRIAQTALTTLALMLLCANTFAQRGFGGSSADRLAPEEIEFRDGTDTLPDRTTFKKLSYQGSEVLIDTHLDGIEFVKFQIENANSEKPLLYFINTNTHRAHMRFMRAAGIGRGGRGQMRGVLVYRPLLKAPSGKSGVYTYEFEPRDSFSFEMVKIAHDLLTEKGPILKKNIGYYPMWGALPLYKEEKAKYDAAEFPVYLDKDLYADIAFLPLNLAESFGRLRLMEVGERPTPRDVVLYKTLPNEMPRVAGIITGVRQTPLSHVNLRAIQDKVPNAYIADAWKNDTVAPLIGKYVRYKVASDGYELREATQTEVDAHISKLRPEEPQVPARDLSVREIRPLDEIGFKDSSRFGVKTANVAALRTFGFKTGTVPDGFGIPFQFYDAFMRHNDLYDAATKLMSDPVFQKDRAQRDSRLAGFRTRIRASQTPGWMWKALSDLQASFPKGRPIRCRSSTNNEDLPGFSGAGLYDSCTHRPDEGHLSKSIKQVYASLWNFRAFEEREFYRIDHLATAMGVLVHPNSEAEQANGVAVTDDVLYQTTGHYYLNVQVGEDLVTNPGESSIPEEILLGWWKDNELKVLRESNRSKDGKRILSDEHVERIRKCLGRIHSRFARLYGKSTDDKRFAMEIEFKITREGRILIKQARPWVY